MNPRKTYAAAALAAGLMLTACAAPAETTTGGKSTSSSTSTSSGSKGAKAKADSGKPSDGGWTLESQQLKDDGLGDFGGTARITNTEDSPQTGVFTLTVFKGDEQVASLQGSADEVEPGKTVTVRLISQDKFKKGPYRVEFQNDI
jgi:hypothetical protein